jgi:hypothetical protein
MNVTPLRPGWRTTEFWTHVFTLLASFVIGFAALLHPGFKDPVWVQAAIPMVATVVAGTSQLVYTLTRKHLKLADLEGMLRFLESHPDVVTAAASAAITDVRAVGAALKPPPADVPKAA